MGCKMMKGMAVFVTDRFGGDSAGIIEDAEARHSRMVSENASDPKAVRMHTEDKIYPCIAYYEAIQAHGVPQDDALAFMDGCWSRMAEDERDSIRTLLKVPGLYRIYPRVYGSAARNLFGEKANFQADFIDKGKHECRFDMKKCLYKDTCTRYGHPELTKCFCHTDFVKADVHPKLGFSRSRCMGEGGELCDFRVFVKEKE